MPDREQAAGRWKRTGARIEWTDGCIGDVEPRPEPQGIRSPGGARATQFFVVRKIITGGVTIFVHDLANSDVWQDGSPVIRTIHTKSKN